MTEAARVRNGRRPTDTGIVIAVVAAAGAVGLLANGSEQLFALAVEVAGISALALGAAVGRRGFRALGTGITFAGAGVVLAALRFGVVLPEGSPHADIPEQVALLVGMVGLAVLALGLLALRSKGSRLFVTLGAAVVGAGALTAGALGETSTVSTFAAVAATMVAWDAAERAISLGEQVGRDADTAAVELVHAGGSTVVGAAAVGVAVGATSVGEVDLPVAGLALLLGAGIVLMLALYR